MSQQVDKKRGSGRAFCMQGIEVLVPGAGWVPVTFKGCGGIMQPGYLPCRGRRHGVYMERHRRRGGLDQDRGPGVIITVKQEKKMYLDGAGQWQGGYRTML
ncbi:hypothetical protein [Chitinophaga sp. S165]|uniref:hypothetical protein n=1 Tax=Chitinophaga sp. S165 TaxID=2135462 RepID=UPI000D71714C|nr:hypothetical protein [Chitinophaga sp. S165]PWV46117.1 hypothetical protein C7475_11119 [Chitinophaga sp. S165]